jgi:hypothetical protein
MGSGAMFPHRGLTGSPTTTNGAHRRGWAFKLAATLALPEEASEPLQRLPRRNEAIVQPTNQQFEHPAEDWIPLARGPFIFRRRWEAGRYFTGTPDDALGNLAHAGFSEWGPRVLSEWDEQDPPCRLRINRLEGTVCLLFRPDRPSGTDGWTELSLHPTSIPKTEASRQQIAALPAYQSS